jgi:membrane protease YdiL (CAAX protease family)
LRVCHRAYDPEMGVWARLSYARRLAFHRDRPPPQPHGLWRLLPRQNLAASVYGTILVSSVIVGLGHTSLTAGWMIAAVAVTALVFALAHAWSLALARSADDRQALRPSHVLDGVRHEWPMVEAVVPALIALTLAALGIYSVRTGLWAAIIANTALLFVWGAILRHRAAGTPSQALAAGLTTALLGLVLVALKAFVH